LQDLFEQVVLQFLLILRLSIRVSQHGHWHPLPPPPHRLLEGNRSPFAVNVRSSPLRTPRTGPDPTNPISAAAGAGVPTRQAYALSCASMTLAAGPAPVRAAQAIGRIALATTYNAAVVCAK